MCHSQALLQYLLILTSLLVYICYQDAYSIDRPAKFSIAKNVDLDPAEPPGSTKDNQYVKPITLTDNEHES